MFNCKSVSDKQERDAIMERIKKKENELQDICSYIDLIETERELDEKIIKANDIKSFLSETSTARRADYEKEAGGCTMSKSELQRNIYFLSLNQLILSCRNTKTSHRITGTSVDLLDKRRSRRGLQREGPR
ncbi:uncharacterized protein LOC128557860 isoform X3 [Mercenaria mercenaria]|uniref:uncharacterized protein LOC128557860 isoform X3 n=1 Tax=Mercenaria mercenaria TaxID=6596 RepID=UPI00234EFD3B|nr:uncharacterized protein LOC128557860 isoform X3 [Mercenaria mercenaria]